ALAVERRTPPRCVEMALFGQLAPRAAQTIDRAAWRFHETWRIRPPQRAADAFGGRVERLLQKRAERAVVEAIRLLFGEDGKQRIDDRLDRTLPQELRAEAVNRVDVRFFERRKRVVEVRRSGARLAAALLERLAQP